MPGHEAIAELHAYEQIRRVVADFCHGFDKRDRGMFQAVWAPDGRWQPMPDGPWLEGESEIVGALDDMWAAFAATHHWTANHSIRISGDRATGVVDAFCLVNPIDGGWFRIAATYQDAYAADDGTWQLNNRTAQIHHYLPVG